MKATAINRICTFVLAGLLMGSWISVTAAKRDLDHERLNAALAELKADPILGSLAPSEIAHAEAALQALLEQRGGAKVQNHLAYIAERRIDIAYATAQTEDQIRKLAQLDREHDQILLEANRREAEQTRLEAEKQRIQNLAQAEETERLRQEAEIARARNDQISQEAEAAHQEAAQAKRVAEAQAKETELARQEAQLAEATAASLRNRLANLKATRSAQGLQMTLDDVAFAPGQSVLKTEAQRHLGKLIEFVNQDKSKPIRIEGHTDSRGDNNANQLLSQKRADSVRDALIAAGVDPKRIITFGLGEEAPVDSNETEAGRARNRRVDIILGNH